MVDYLVFILVLPKFGDFLFSKVNAFWKFGVDFWKFGVLKTERNEAKKAKSEAKKVEKVAQKHRKCAIFGPPVTCFHAHRPSKIVQNVHFSLQNASEFWTFWSGKLVEILNTASLLSEWLSDSVLVSSCRSVSAVLSQSVLRHAVCGRFCRNPTWADENPRLADKNRQVRIFKRKWNNHHWRKEK